MNAIVKQVSARDELIDEALYDATCDGDGRPRPNALEHHLAKRGFVIVDASLTGVMKPDPRAFRGGTEALGLPADRIVYLDDMPWNVEAARQAGMTAVRVPLDGPGPAIDTARELLGLSPRPEPR